MASLSPQYLKKETGEATRPKRPVAGIKIITRNRAGLRSKIQPDGRHSQDTMAKNP